MSIAPINLDTLTSPPTPIDAARIAYAAGAFASVSRSTLWGMALHAAKAAGASYQDARKIADLIEQAAALEAARKIQLPAPAVEQDSPRTDPIALVDWHDLRAVERAHERATLARDNAIAHLRYTIAQLDQAYTVERRDQLDATRERTPHTPRERLADVQRMHDESLAAYTEAERTYRVMSDLLDEQIRATVTRPAPQPTGAPDHDQH